MKNLTTAFIGFSIVLLSCGGDVSDIDVDDLESPCDCVDAMITVADNAISIADGVEDDDELSNAQKEELRPIWAKFEEVEERCDKLRVKRSETKKCANFKELKDKMDIVEKLD